MRASIAWLLTAALLCLLIAPPLQAQTTEADVYVAQAIIDVDDKRYDEALKNLQEALRLEPDHVEALYYTGVVHMALRRPAEAVPYLLRGSETARPTSPSPFSSGSRTSRRSSTTTHGRSSSGSSAWTRPSTASATTSATCVIATRTIAEPWARSGPGGQRIPLSSSSRASTVAWPSRPSACLRRPPRRSSKHSALRRARR